MHRGCIIMVSMPKCDCAAATIAWSPEVARIDELISKCCRAAHIYGLCLFDSALSVFYIFIPIWIICWLCLQFHWWTLADVKLQLYGVNYSSKTNNLFSGTQSLRRAPRSHKGICLFQPPQMDNPQFRPRAPMSLLCFMLRGFRENVTSFK